MTISDAAKGMFALTIDIAENCMAVMREKGKNWRTFARELSVSNGGQWFPRANGVTWVNGRQVGYILDVNHYDVVRDARSICKDLGVVGVGWSIGNCSRKILSWIDAAQTGSGGCRPLITGHNGYYDASPGEYTHGYLYDIEAAHYHLWSRLPSLKVSYASEKKDLRWYPMTPEQSQRHRDSSIAVKYNKTLRNAIVGAALGGEGESVYYYRGEKRGIQLGRGLNYAAAAVVIRSTWELCRQASEDTEAIASCVDSIICQVPSSPKVWYDKGLEGRLKSHGPTDIKGPTTYKVGPLQTGDYLEPRITHIDRQLAPMPQIYNWL